jgi:hypothetical protein
MFWEMSALNPWKLIFVTCIVGSWRKLNERVNERLLTFYVWGQQSWVLFEAGILLP